MSKEMKDFLSQFMNQTPAPPVVETPKTEPVEVVKPKAVKKTKENTAITPKKVKTLVATEVVGEDIVSAEAFLKSINEKKYTFDKKKNLQIDDQLFAILNLLKQFEGIKSIATLLNAIVEKYIEDNKVELKKILSKNPLG